ncbi:hypothetical protein EV702DRAFT_1267465 [Suillus placidus]|uniref:Uncharacterized protein n=1 Tax=Suillus placidus TaxID=48579 RepID=A0A9P6ZZZ5_9AGAM|nr:hypothetical protein EV702DRAFT_1267465 [Suillus placidus]
MAIHPWKTREKPPGGGCLSDLVLPWSGPEPWFEPDFWSGSSRFSPWFSYQPEPDRKTVLGSRSSRTVPFWFGLAEPFRTVIDFDFDFDFDRDNVGLHVKLLSSGFALLVNQATFSLFKESCVVKAHIN